MIQEQALIYKDGDTQCKAYVALPSASLVNIPCVLVVHDWGGQNDFARHKARELVKLGYVGFAVDMYGEQRVSDDADQKNQWMMPFIENRRALSNRIVAAFNAACKLPQVDELKIAIMGYCFGGLCALDLARSGANIKGAVSFHGLLFPPEQTVCERIKAKVLVLHGYDDPMCKPDQLDEFALEMRQKKVDWQLNSYGNTLHAFTNPNANEPLTGLKYNALAEQRSWLAATSFFEEIFND